MKRTVSFLLALFLFAGIYVIASAESPTGFFGTVNEQTYRNDFFDLKFEVDPDWVLYDALTTAEKIAYTRETISTTADLFRQFSEIGVVYDLLTEKTENEKYSLVQVTMMDLKTMFGFAPDTEVLVQMLVEQIKKPMVDVYEVVNVTKENMLFAGKERPSFRIEASLTGLAFYEQVVLIRQEDYLAMISAATTVDNTAADLLSHFHPIVDEKTRVVLDEARLLINQGKGLEAMKQLLLASKTSDDPALETAILRLENSQWKKVSQTIYNNTSGNILNIYTYEYNDAGRCAETSTFSADGELRSRSVYHFDANGFPCGTTEYDADGNEIGQSVIVCDELGNIARQEGSVTYIFIQSVRRQYHDPPLRSIWART